MDLLKEVFRNEVFPALGCTEPIAVAWACAHAASCLPDEPRTVCVTVDPGVYKNGFAVAVPNTQGRRGNAIAAALGALIRDPSLEMEILREVTPARLEQADAWVREGRVRVQLDRSKRGLFVQADVQGENHAAMARLEGSHRRLVHLECDGRVLHAPAGEENAAAPGYRERLKSMKLLDFAEMAKSIDESDETFLREGIFMNMHIARAGLGCRRVGHYLADLRERGYLIDDVLSSTRILTASAADARMGGVGMPVMSSGASGNQGIVAILVPYNVGRYFKVEERRILESIALSHLVNAYVKCYTGSLSPLCGCAIASGVGAAVAIVYQLAGADGNAIRLAVNNVVSDLGGMLCDGAKSGCALKVASSTESAILSAYMAISGHGIDETEGFVGRSAEETIWNLSTIGHLGMAMADDTMLRIMEEKAGGDFSAGIRNPPS